MTPSGTLDGFDSLPHDLEQYLSSIERETIMKALMVMRWNRTKTARVLGISFRALRYRLAKLGIEDNGAGPRCLPDGFNTAWPKLREVAFKIHGRKCARCGARGRHGTKLHVDHIKALSRFPELALDLSNLQILCEKCNITKGARSSDSL